jgi:hypothetical protein
MKTLKEAIALAHDGPMFVAESWEGYKFNLNGGDGDAIAKFDDEVDAQLAAHCINVLPEVVAALESCAELLGELARTSASNDQADAIDAVSVEVRTVLSKANQVEVLA